MGMIVRGPFVHIVYFNINMYNVLQGWSFPSGTFVISPGLHISQSPEAAESKKKNLNINVTKAVFFVCL